MSQRSFWSLIVPALCVLSLTGAGSTPNTQETRGSCDLWMRSIANYDHDVDSIMNGEEAEQLLGDLHEAVSLMERGNVSALRQLQSRASRQISALERIDPPAELASYHAKLMDYHLAIFRVTRKAHRVTFAVRRRDVRICYVTLIATFEELHEQLVLHGCHGGDAEALEQNIIPSLRSRLENPATPASR